MFNYDATGIEPSSGGYKVAPDGEYWLSIVDASDEKEGEPRRTKKNGYPYVMVECAIADGDYVGTKVWHVITFIPKGEKGAGIALNFLKHIEEPYKDKIEPDPGSWVNKKFKAKLIETKDNKNRPKNAIAWLCDKEETDDSSVPF